MESKPIGREVQQHLLADMYHQGRLPHALLLCGQEGVGALPLALWLAQLMLCTAEKAAAPCGRCPACHKASRFIHPDLHFSFPMNKPRNGSTVKENICSEVMDVWRNFVWEQPYMEEAQWYKTLDMDNKQGIINVAEAERIIGILNLKPYEADLKILLMWLPERLHPTAANKLLKIVEEPPAGTFFLFVSAQPHKVLQTIRSRCLSLWIPPIPRDMLAAALEKDGLPPETAQSYARLSGGSYSRAHELLRQETGDTQSGSLFDRLMDACLAGHYSALMDWADEVAALDKETAKAFLLFCQQMVREYMVISLGQDSLACLGESERAKGRDRTSRIPFSFYEKAHHLCHAALTDLERNVNPKAVFTTFALDFMPGPSH